MRITQLILPFGLLLASAIYSLALTPYVGESYDDGVYIGLAQSLAQGEGYRQPLTPDRPLESKYPPGWPLLLSLVWLLAPTFPANAVGFKFLSVLCALAFAAVTYRWMRWRGENEILATLVSLLTLFNPLILGFTTSAFSEMAYAAFSMLALWLIQRYAHTKERIWPRALLASLAAAWTVYIRSFGLTLILAAVAYLLAARQWRKTLTFITLSAIWIGPYLLYSALLFGNVQGYSQQFWLKSIEQPELGVIGWGDLLLRLMQNLRIYLLAGLPGVIFPSQVPLTYVNLPTALQVGAPLTGLDILLAMLVGSGVLGQIILRRDLADWYLAAYLTLALLWPWEPTRFCVPLIPLLYEYFFQEIRFLAALFKLRPALISTLRVAGLTLAAAFILTNVAAQVRYAWTTHQSPPSPAWTARLLLFDWLRVNTTETDSLAAMNDYQVYLYTQRPIVRLSRSKEEIAGYGVKYVVLIPYGGVMVGGDLSRLRFEALFGTSPEDAFLVYEDSAAGIEVYKLVEQP